MVGVDSMIRPSKTDAVVEVKVRLLGVLRRLSEKSEFLLRLEKPVSAGEFVQRLAEALPPEFGRALVDPELRDPRPNALILVNGREISVLKGLHTEVNDGSEITLIPVSHGG